MNIISYRSLAHTLNNDSDELSARTTKPEGTELTLEQYMARLLDSTQLATYSMVQAPLTPPSGHGSNRPTVRVPCADAVDEVLAWAGV